MVLEQVGHCPLWDIWKEWGDSEVIMTGRLWGDTACNEWVGPRDAECPVMHGYSCDTPLTEKTLESMFPHPDGCGGRAGLGTNMVLFLPYEIIMRMK